jgi:hypothetical protein
MSRLASTNTTGAEVGPALQQTPTVAFDCDSPLLPHGEYVRSGQQPSPATPREQASAGMATPKRLNQIARMPVSRRSTVSPTAAQLCRR